MGRRLSYFVLQYLLENDVRWGRQGFGATKIRPPKNRISKFENEFGASNRPPENSFMRFGSEISKVSEVRKTGLCAGCGQGRQGSIRANPFGARVCEIRVLGFDDGCKAGRQDFQTTPFGARESINRNRRGVPWGMPPDPSLWQQKSGRTRRIQGALIWGQVRKLG